MQNIKRQPKAKLKKPVSSRRKKEPFIWDDNIFDPVKGEKAIWHAVITQAMMDALSNSSKREEQYHKEEAIHWLTGNSKNFRTVCTLAGMDADVVREKAKKCLASPNNSWRAAPGKGKRYHERRAYRLRMQTINQSRPTAPQAVVIPVQFESVSV